MKFSAHALAQALSQFPVSRHLRVGLSGGMDSVVLLHALTELAENRDWQLSAIHINHGINPAAPQWQAFCENLCGQLHVPLQVETLQLDLGRDSGLEEQARAARYGAFAACLVANDSLVLAHHLDDQMETLLLRLLRGAGPGGLAGMPAQRTLGPGRLIRPLLAFSRASLEHYANSAGLAWVEDDSNADTRFDRNFCRHQLLPCIESRWPDYRQRFSKTRQLWSESDLLLQELAAEDLARVVTDQPTVLDLGLLSGWVAARQRNLLRYWLRQIGVPMAGWNLLQRLVNEILPARVDAAASLNWQSLRLQRFRDRLYALRIADAFERQDYAWSWRQTSSVVLPHNGVLTVTWPAATVPADCNDTLQVHYRDGGERCRLPGRPQKTVKQLLQEADMPPWLRDRVPLLYQDERLAAIPGLGINSDGPLAASAEAPVFSWQAPDLSFVPESVRDDDF